MNFLDLKDISERDMELVNPTSLEKVLAVGRAAGMSPGKHVIDFGSGFGEALAVWAEDNGISGVGIDIRPKACERARTKMQARDLTARIEIVCMNAAEYVFAPHSFDVAACIGASFIWGGYREALQHLREAIKPEGDGAVIIGEPYWQASNVPPEYSRNERVHTQFELLQIAREEGFDVAYVARASHDEWDRYERDNWHGLIKWLKENPDHPERQQVFEHLRQSQDEYFRYAREYFGWAIYVLLPTHQLGHGKP